MTPAQWERVTTLFGEAHGLPEQDRAAFLARACPDDETIRREVLDLLAADRDDAFLERGARVQPADLLEAAVGPTYAAGDRLGPYRIDTLLARGGMGVLYVATDTRLGRRVALKVLPAVTARDARARTRLQREARLASLLRHPHIVSVHALEEIGDTLVIVSEYIEGPTLADAIERDGPLPRQRWREVARALADALAAAHAARVIHRDVKASNIVLGPDGVRLVDFGIALGEADGGDTRLTHVGQFSGTPLAQAPEQLEGGPATALSDQYAFGLVLYQAASGHLPFGDGPVAAVWARMLRDQPTPLSAAARHLAHEDIAIVHRCLARRPEDRFPSMRDVLAALSATSSPAVTSVGHETRAALRPVAGPRPAWRWWDVHQLTTTALYIGLLWPGASVAGVLPPRWRSVAYLALVSIAAAATSLRLHLWFSATHYPPPVAALRRRWWPVVAGIDVIYAGVVGSMALAVADLRLVPALVAAGLAVCLLIASLVIEPATRRASDM